MSFKQLMFSCFYRCWLSLSLLVLIPYCSVAANPDDIQQSLSETEIPPLPPTAESEFAQTPAIPLPQDLRPSLPETLPVPEIPPHQLSEPLLQSPPLPESSPESPPVASPDSDTITVKKFIFVGNTVFSQERLEQELNQYLNSPLSFAELLQARTVITELYTKAGYMTTGAYIPGDQIIPGESAVVKIRIIEGSVEEIRVNGTRRLNPNYLRSRLRLATSTPLREQRLLDALKLLQVNPLIEQLSAELSAGTRPGTSVLEISVKEADTFNTQLSLNNSRSPSVGSFRRRVGLTEANLLGEGDRLSIGYTNTDGSGGLDLSYTRPINPRNGTLSFSYGTTSSQVIEPPFDQLDIDSDSRYYEFTLRQPISQTPTQEIALGLTASRTESATSLSEIPFPLSPGADQQGRTQVSAIRFFQEWTQQSRRHVFAVRSQFSLGIDAFDPTINDNAPDSRFFAWRGQGQWVRLLGSGQSDPTAVPTLIVRGDVQLTNQPLLSTEQFGLGGFGSIRGYRQDTLLTDSGALASAEVRLPILRIPKWQTVLQLIPFIDLGTGWNSGDSENPNPDTLAAVGLGLQLIQSRRFSARLDWGIPLISVSSTERTWQENGIYFTLEFNPF